MECASVVDLRGNWISLVMGLCDLQVEIKRTIPKGAVTGKDFKTKKIFVGGIPTAVGEGLLLVLFFYLAIQS